MAATRNHKLKKIQRLRRKMLKLRKDQQCIRERQTSVRQRLAVVEQQCNQLREQTKQISQQAIITRICLVVMFQVLKARQAGDFSKAANLTHILRFGF